MAIQAETTLLLTSFSTNPAADNGTVTICQGQSITYTNTSTGVGSNPTFAWTFQGGSTATATSAGPHTITYNSSGTFTTTLTVNGSSSNVNVVVNSALPPNLTIGNTASSGYSTSIINGVTHFIRCGTLTFGNFNFVDQNISSYPTGTSFNVSWGDGTPNSTSIENHVYNGIGTYQLIYTITYPNGCVVANNYTVFVGNSPPTLSITGSGDYSCIPNSYQFTIGANPSPGTVYTISVNDGSQPIVFYNSLPTNPYIFNYVFNTTSCGTNSVINNNTYTDAFSIQVTASNPCNPQGTFTSIGPIRVSEETTSLINQSLTTTCINNPVTFNDVSISGESASQTGCNSIYGRFWQISPSTGFTLNGTSMLGTSNGFTEANNQYDWSEWTNGSQQLGVSFSVPGVYTITLTTGNGCGMDVETTTICVNPEVIADFTVSSTEACAPTTVTLDNLSSLPGCSNANVYAWQVTHTNPQNCPNASSPGWSFTSGNASSFEPEITFTSAGVYTVQLTTSLQNAVAGSLCQPDVKSRIITIKDKPKTTLTSQTICEGTTLTLNPTVFNCYATQAATYSWDFGSNPPASISSTTSSSPSVTFTAAGTYNYTLTLTNECGSSTFSSFIVVDPAVQITATGPSATCLNTGIPLTGSITGGATTGTWTASITGGTFSPNATALLPTYTPPANFVGTITFTLTSADPAGPCTAKTISFPVVVNAQATAEAGTYNPVCQNGSLQLNGIVGGAASSGSWTSSNGGTFSDATSLTSTYLPPAGFIGTIVLTLTTNDPPGPCEPETDTVTITVISTPTINSISDVVVCHNGNVGPISFSGTNATNYSWTNSNPAIGLVASGTSAISFVGTNTGNAPITGTITVTPFNTSGATSCTGTPITFTITINPRGQVNAIPGQVICNGVTVTIPDFSTTNSGGTTSYAWTSSNLAVGLAASGNGNIGSFTATNTSTAPISTLITVVPTFTNGSVSCSGPSKSITITVNPTAQVNQPNNVVFCAGTPSTAIPFSTTNTDGATTYNWTNDTSSIGLGASGTGNIAVFTPVNNTTSPIIATITVIPTFANGGTSCTGPSETFTITINPKGQVNTISNIVVCNGNTIPEIVFSTNNTGGTATYNWTNNTTSIGLAASGSGNITAFNAVNNGTSPVTATITVTPIFTNSTNCSGTPITFTIIVNPNARVSTITNKTVCNNTTLPAINFATTNTGGTPSYTWTNDTPSIGLGASGTGNIAAFTAINTGTSPIIATIEVTPSYTNNSVICSGTPTTFTITVNPTGQVNHIANQILCNGTSISAVAFSTNNAVGTTTYSWINSNPAIGLAASGSGAISAFNVTNSSPSPIIGTITVTPSFLNGAPACEGTTESFTITVNPSPAVSFSPTNQTICSDYSSSLVTLSSSTTGATFAWTAVQPAGITGVITSGTNTIPAQTLVNTTNAPITITYAAVASTNDASACAGSIFNYTITVNPKPAIENQALVICSEQGFTIAPIDGTPNASTIVPVGTTYTWTISTNTNITGANAGTGSQISQILTNSSNTIQTIIYNVTPTAGTCVGSPFTITVEVYPKPDVQFDLANQTICNNSATSLVNLSSSLPGAITFAWTANIPTGISGAIASGTNTIPVQTLINSTNAPLTITYTAAATYTNNGNSCTGNDTFYTIIVNPTFTASGVLSNYNGYNVSVFGNNDGTIDLTVIGGSSAYTFSWTGPNGFTATTEDLTGLFAGTYTVTINDGYCAPIVLTFTLTQPPELLVQQDPALTINLLCFGDSNGAVGIQITQESVSPYDYTLLNSANIVVQSVTNTTNLNPQFTGLIAGTYSVLVTDANGGTKTVTGLVVSQPNDIVITPTITEITCYGANNASISLAITGGTAPYVANWSNLATGFFQDNLAAGSYTITITDANGCIKPITINIIEAPIFTINPVVTNISCFGANNGSINLNLIGGQAPVVVTWSDGSTSGTVRNNLVPGTYTVLISDGTPCYINRTFIIVEPQPLVLNATVQNALDCLNPNSGAINLVVSGGTQPFTYAWSNGATTEDLTAITNGNYSVVVTDSRGCIKTASYTVSRPQPLTVIVDQDSQVNCTTGLVTNSFEAHVTGGMPPFVISWSSGTVSGTNNELMSTTQDGLITVTITDAIGCTTSESITISNPIIGNAGFTQGSFALTTYGIYSINDPIQFTNTATGDFVSVAWNFGDGIFSTEENPIHTYVLEGNYIVTQTVTYPLGCIKTNIITLIITKGYKLMIPSGFTANDDSINDTFKPEFEGLENISLQVYDTWGNVVYYEKGETIVGWNGQINGVPAENGNYYYKVIGTTFYGDLIEKSGPFTLIK